MYIHQESKAFHVSVFMKIKNAQQHCAQISDTELHANDTTHLESMDRF